MAGGSPAAEPTAGLKVPAVRADGASVTTPPRSVVRPSALLRDVADWAASCESLPWRGDMVRAALAPAVVVAAAVAPLRAVPLTAVALVAGSYLLLVSPPRSAGSTAAYACRLGCCWGSTRSTCSGRAT